MRQDTRSSERQDHQTPASMPLPLPSASWASGAAHPSHHLLDEQPEVDEAQHWWTSRRRVIAVCLWVIGLIFLALLSVAAHRYAVFPGDVGITAQAQRLHSPQLLAFINFASDANWPKPAGIIALTVIGLLALIRRVRAAICTAFAGFGADLANVTLNGLVARPRPHNTQIHVVAHLGLHSYPSGHVTHVTAFYGFLLYLLVAAWRAHPRWRVWLWAPATACLYFLVFIGPSRVLEGEHWPSDVVGSWLLGALMLVAAIALYHLLAGVWERIRARQQRSKGAFAPRQG